jgi:predicted ATPase/DNA-binding SARP family transcriptional activator
VELAVLGPLEVVGGPGIEVQGSMVRRLAAALAVSPRGASVDVLVEALWGDDPPASCRKTLQGFVHRLRRALGASAVVTTTNGYRFDLERVQLDVVSFESELDAAAALRGTVQPREAIALVEAALRRWRGLPFPELGVWPGVLADRARLTERRRLGEELRAELRIEDGVSEMLVGDLEALVADAPLRERRWSLLIEATRRAGRSSEALRMFERARSTLVDALGAEPGPSLQRLYRQLLNETDALAGDVARCSTVPTPRTSFVGRDADLAVLDEFLERERLVTLVGVGGSGKTRLAIELGRRWLRRRAEPVWFADLTALVDPAGIASAVSAATGRTGPVESPDAAVAAAVAGEKGLLIIDNAEHLLGEVASMVDDVLEGVPGVRFVVTSREPLGLEGEVHWPVGPLSGGLTGDAVTLFVARARACAPNFSTEEEQLAEVAKLCTELDRLPLALELAAARVGALSPAELRRQLAVHGGLPAAFGPPHGRPRPGRARWTSIAAALRWSTDALTTPTRLAFARLAVLPDSFDLAAAAQVCGLDEGETLHVVESLHRKSLLETSPAPTGTRFRMLETVRRHAATELAGAPATEADARGALLRWAVAQGAGYERLVAEHDTGSAIQLADREQHNLRAALDWAAAGGSAADGVTVIVSTEDWWRAAGHTAEAWERLRALLDRADAGPELQEHIWLRGVTCLAVFAAFLDEAAQHVAADFVERALQRLEGVGDAELRLRMATELAWVQLDLSDTKAGDRLRVNRPGIPGGSIPWK